MVTVRNSDGSCNDGPATDRTQAQSIEIPVQARSGCGTCAFLTVVISLVPIAQVRMRATTPTDGRGSLGRVTINRVALSDHRRRQGPGDRHQGGGSRVIFGRGCRLASDAEQETPSDRGCDAPHRPELECSRGAGPGLFRSTHAIPDDDLTPVTGVGRVEVETPPGSDVTELAVREPAPALVCGGR